MTNFLPTKASTTETPWVSVPTIPIAEVSFDGAMILANRYASHGDEIDPLLQAAQAVLPVLRGAKVIETARDDNETVARVRTELGDDTNKPILLWVAGGDNAYRCGARSAVGNGFVVAGVGLGNGNVAQKITNSEKFHRHPEKLLEPGKGVIREQYLFEVFFNGEWHVAATNAGFGETGVGAHKISHAMHREHPLYKTRSFREMKEYLLALQSIYEIKRAHRVVPILEDGEIGLVLGRDFMFGPEMAKVADMPYTQLDDPEAIYFDMVNHTQLARWVYGVQTGTLPYKRLSAGETHSIEVLNETYAYLDGDPHKMEPGIFRVRYLPDTYKALTVTQQRTEVKRYHGVRGFVLGFRPVLTSMIARW